MAVRQLWEAAMGETEEVEVTGWAIAMAIAATALAGFTVGWRMGADGEFDAGRAVGRTEAQRCGEDVQ